MGNKTISELNAADALDGTEEFPLVQGTTKKATIDQVSTYINGGAPYKIYSALVTQSGSSAPTVIVLRNTLSAAPVWTRSSTGIYYATLAGEWTVDKTTIDIGLLPLSDYETVCSGGRDSGGNILAIRTFSITGNALADGKLDKTLIEFRVYA